MAISDKTILDCALKMRNDILDKTLFINHNEEEIKTALWTNYLWLTRLLSPERLHEIDAAEFCLRNTPEECDDGLLYFADLHYRGLNGRLEADDYGQCYDITINQKTYGLGAYNLNYREDAESYMRYFFFLNIQK